MPETFEDFLDANVERHFAEVCAALRFPSVSALPDHRADLVATAQWIVERLHAVGVPEVELLQAGGHPVVFGRWIVDPQQPVAMVYGHYDVQPVDPLELWVTGPFEPTVRDGLLFARGAADNKGNIVAVIQAVEALVRTGAAGCPPVNLLFFFEGEEEIGSPTVVEAVRGALARMACDVVISCDGVMYAADKPSLTISSKGMLGGEIVVRTAAADLHSGLYGAAAPNAVQVLAQLLGSLHTSAGAVAVSGFYEQARAVSAAERAETALVPFDETEFLAGTGAAAVWGEPGYSVLERLWLRPTLDLNGIGGGFQGAGSKTVTPCEARAKFSCRLVSGQQPDAVMEQIRRHIALHTPPWAQAVVEARKDTAAAFEIRRNHPTLLAAAGVLRDLYGKEPLYIRLGGTLPIAETFVNLLGAEMVFFSWEQTDNNLHAPNESVRLSDLAMARRAWCALLTRLAGHAMK